MWKNQFDLSSNRHFFYAWFTSAAVTVFLPLLFFTVARLRNSNNAAGDDNNNDDQAYNYNGQQQQNNNGAPWWWLWAEGNQRRQGFNPTLILIYFWSLLLFGGILYYGYFIIDRNISSLIAALLVYANLCVLSMLFLGGLQGGVQVDGPQIQEDGFYGQMGVLLWITNFFGFVFSVVFAYLLRRRMRHANVETIEIDESEYKPYKETDETA